jgi:DNA-binding protein H-NS
VQLHVKFPPENRIFGSVTRGAGPFYPSQSTANSSAIRNCTLFDGERAAMALKTMSVTKLQDLKAKIDVAINAKVSERRRELEAQLSKLSGFGGRGATVTKFGRGARAGPVAPKYRNPENPAETWAGRGLKPRWLAAAIKSGKKLEDFAIAPGTAASKANGRKKAGGATAKARAARPTYARFATFRRRRRTTGGRTVTRRKRQPLSAEELKERGLMKV